MNAGVRLERLGDLGRDGKRLGHRQARLPGRLKAIGDGGPLHQLHDDRRRAA